MVREESGLVWERARVENVMERAGVDDFEFGACAHISG